MATTTTTINPSPAVSIPTVSQDVLTEAEKMGYGDEKQSELDQVKNRPIGFKSNPANLLCVFKPSKLPNWQKDPRFEDLPKSWTLKFCHFWKKNAEDFLERKLSNFERDKQFIIREGFPDSFKSAVVYARALQNFGYSQSKILLRLWISKFYSHVKLTLQKGLTCILIDVSTCPIIHARSHSIFP